MTQRRRRYVGIAMLALAAAVTPICSNAAASSFDTVRDVEMRSAALGTALVKLGQMFGVILSFDPELVARRQSVELHGRYTLQESLAQMLAETGLTFSITPSGTVTIAPAPTSGVRDGGSLTPLRVSAVMAEEGSPMHAATVSIAGRPDTFGSDLPQAVTVLTPELLKLTGAETAESALDFIVGSAWRGGDLLGASQPRPVMRGLPMSMESHGLRNLNGARIDNAFVERIEVLRGPGGVISGIADDGGRGGVVEIVTKRAAIGSKTEVTAAVDSADHGNARASVDMGGALQRGWAWRLVTVGSASGRTDAGYDSRHNNGLLASTSWRDDRSNFALSMMTESRRDTALRATRELMAFDDQTGFNVFAGLAPGFIPAPSGSDGTASKSRSTDLEFGQRVGAWHIDLRARDERLSTSFDDHQYFPVNESFATVNQRIDRTVARQQQVRLDLSRDALTGPLSHGLLFALQTRRHTEQIGSSYASWTFDSENRFLPGITPLPISTAIFSSPMDTRSDTDRHDWSWTVQDQIRFDAWRLLASVQNGVQHVTDSGADRVGVHGTSWDLGLGYQWSPSLTLYAGMQSVLEVGGGMATETLDDGLPPPPRRNHQEQVGMKFDLDEDRLALAVEVFRLRQTNLYDPGASNAEAPPSTMPGRSSKGLEVELSGRFSRALDGLVGLNLHRSNRGTIDFNDIHRGQYQADDDSIPARALRALLRARLPKFDMADDAVLLTLAARARSHTMGQVGDPNLHNVALRLPGGAQFDLGLVRKHGPWELSATLFNAMNRRLYSTYADPNLVPLLPARHLRLALIWRP